MDIKEHDLECDKIALKHFLVNYADEIETDWKKKKGRYAIVSVDVQHAGVVFVDGCDVHDHLIKCIEEHLGNRIDSNFITPEPEDLSNGISFNVYDLDNPDPNSSHKITLKQTWIYYD